jgi:hypothetical protein
MGTPTGGGLVQALFVAFPVEVPHVAHVQSIGKQEMVRFTMVINNKAFFNNPIRYRKCLIHSFTRFQNKRNRLSF